MSSSFARPFDVMRWDAPNPPTPAFLVRWLEREGYRSSECRYEPGTHTCEMKFGESTIHVLVQGKIQYSFPGYGVVELSPGDRLDITPDTLYDIKVTSAEPAITLASLTE